MDFTVLAGGAPEHQGRVTVTGGLARRVRYGALGSEALHELNRSSHVYI